MRVTNSTVTSGGEPRFTVVNWGKVCESTEQRIRAHRIFAYAIEQATGGICSNPISGEKRSLPDADAMRVANAVKLILNHYSVRVLPGEVPTTEYFVCLGERGNALSPTASTVSELPTWNAVFTTLGTE